MAEAAGGIAPPRREPGVAYEEFFRKRCRDHGPDDPGAGGSSGGNVCEMDIAFNRQRKWTMHVPEEAPLLGISEDLRVTVRADTGNLVLNLGEFSAGKKWDVIVDDQGTHIRVGDRVIPLRGQERPTIVIGGNRSNKPKKANNEPLRVLRVEGNGPSPGDGGRKGDKS